MKNISFSAIIISLLALLINYDLKAELLKYDIAITEKTIAINKNKIVQLLLNGSSPGPTIKGKFGDTLEIKINNKSNKDIIIHWHGVLLPNNQDGVAGVTQPAIKAKSAHTYKFDVKQTGTYWYHAHGLEEAQGIYGGIIFKDKSDNNTDNLILFGGELDKNPEEILQDLNPTFNWRTTSVHSIHNSNNVDKAKAYPHSMHQSGHEVNGNKAHFSDITYYKYLINGKESDFLIPKVSENKVMLRIVNTYVDGFLNLVYSGGDIVVIASDGLPTKPVSLSNLPIAMGETYDIILEVKDSSKSYELVAFIMGMGKHSKVIIGKGNLISLSSYKEADYPLASAYNKLQTLTPSYLDFSTYNNIINYEISLKEEKEGSYNWKLMIDEKAIDKLDIKVGDKVKVKIKNMSMMPHPMHLHGFFFKVISEKNNLIKHTININPMKSVEIEFIADAEGKWLFHCHNLFHMASAMMLTFSVTK